VKPDQFDINAHRAELRGRMSKKVYAALARRTAQRAQDAKIRLGTLWCFHPANKVTRSTTQGA
jgi:hypothetical protein